MKGDELVSVIIPVFNVKPYLAEALDSVLNQSYGNLEIIVINDGSTDGSEEICDEYKNKDNRIIVFHQENKGLSSARNAGLDRASGQFISFLDPDDAMHPDMLQILLTTMKKENADIAICGFSFINTQNRMPINDIAKDGISSKAIDKNEALQGIFNGSIDTAVWNKLYTSSVWEGMRFPDGYVFEGTYIAFDIFDRVNSVVIVEKDLVMHRDRPGSICHTASLKNIMDGGYAFNHYASFVKAHIPQVFSKEQMDKLTQSRISRNIIAYLQYGYSNPQDTDGKEAIRGMLTRIGKEEGLHCCSLPIKIEFLLIRSFPNITGKIFFIYKCLKKKGLYSRCARLGMNKG